MAANGKHIKKARILHLQCIFKVSLPQLKYLLVQELHLVRFSSHICSMTFWAHCTQYQVDRDISHTSFAFPDGFPGRRKVS